LLAVPALRALRAATPGAAIGLAAQPRIGRLLAILGTVDRALDFDSLGLSAFFAGHPSSAPADALRAWARVICWFGARDPTFVANLRAAVPHAMVAPPAAGDDPVWQHLRRSVGAPPAGDSEVFDLPATVLNEGRRVLRGAGWDGRRSLIMVHPGADSALKRGPLAGFAAVAAALQRERSAAVVVHQGPADAEVAPALRAKLGHDALLLTEPSLEALAGALGLVSLYLGNDSGVSHLAAAVGAPCVVLFTSALLPWKPWAAHPHLATVSTGELNQREVTAVAELARMTMT
jgi:lipopolysaccharide heptosyltransferase III